MYVFKGIYPTSVMLAAAVARVIYDSTCVCVCLYIYILFIIYNEDIIVGKKRRQGGVYGVADEEKEEKKREKIKNRTTRQPGALLRVMVHGERRFG